MSARRRRNRWNMNLPTMEDLGAMMHFFLQRRGAAVLACVILLLVFVIGLVPGIFIGRGMSRKKAASSGQEQDSGTDVETDAETDAGTGAEQQSQPVAAPADVPLEKNARAEVNDLMAAYYRAVTEGDRAQIQAVTDITDEETLLYLEKRSDYIEAYQDLDIYTKTGPETGSYVVYASYNVKLYEMDNLVPGITPFLVFPRGDGTLYIHESSVSAEVNQYLEEVSAQEDVVDLMNDVQTRYDDVVASDPQIAAYLSDMQNKVQVAVGEALELAGGTSSTQAPGTQQTEGTQQQEGQGLTPGSVAYATDTVNVRDGASETANRVGQLQPGTQVPVLEVLENGWTKVSYSGAECYIKSEYLSATAPAAPADQGNGGGGAPSGASGAAGSASAAGGLPASGTVKVAEAVNVRSSASETAEILGVCYPGEELQIVSHQSDGWTQVLFKGQTGYVKTSVLKVAEN